MILEIPILYQTMAIPPRHRNAAIYGVHGYRVLLRVDELESGDAPLAATMKNDAHRGGLQEEYRQHGGGLVRRHLIPGPDNSWLPIRAETVQDELNRRNHFRAYGQVLFHKRPDADKISGWLQHGIPVRATEWSKIRDVETEVRAALAGAVFVGGDLHLRSLGPCWSLGHSNSRTDMVAIAEFSADRGVWRGDRYADALDAGLNASASQSARLLRPDPGPLLHGEIEIHRPEAFTVDDDWAVLRIGVSRVVIHCRKQMPDWTRPDIEAWLDLRDTLSAWPERADEATLSTVTRFRARTADRFDAMHGSSMIRHGLDRLELRGMGLQPRDADADGQFPRFGGG